jgi:Fur family transcriptional regulator, peroxide stress response regulator
MTPQRLEILREVSHRTDHPDAELLFKAVRKRLPTVSLDTVYRTLWLFTEHGLLQTLGPRQTAIRFDPNLRAHHHYVCVNCERVWDVEESLVSPSDVSAAVSSLGTVVATHVEIRGLCSKCLTNTSLHPPRRG